MLRCVIIGDGLNIGWEMRMLSERDLVMDAGEVKSLQTHLDQALLAAFCRTLHTSHLTPMDVMRLMARALGSVYREVEAIHQDGRCSCGWQPSSATDVQSLQQSLTAATVPQSTNDLRSMTVIGQA